MEQKPINVSQLNAYIKRILSSDPLLGNVTVIGEISNFKHHSNGHVYFTLKDDFAGINCFLPSNVFNKLRFEIGNGIEVTIRGYINVYERGGSYSLNVRELLVEGAGNLAVAFEMLKAKLEKEGLFEEKYKKPIPRFPKNIAIVTSNTGAAIEDMLKIIKSKNNYVNILIYPSLVQGPDAAQEIANGIKYINENKPYVDTIIVGRGGGSAEDLWAFNEEVLARAIFDSVIPVISAVGHESDITISDYVADIRAETPTAAAGIAVPDIDMLYEYLTRKKIEMNDTVRNIFNMKHERLRSKNISELQRILQSRIRSYKVEIDHLNETNKSRIDLFLYKADNDLKNLNDKLTAFNPQNIMDRGYAALIASEDGTFITSTDDVNVGEQITAVLKDGKLLLTTDKKIGGTDGN